MSQQSSIEWTDATWNPVRGCTKISPGCKNCYAETFAERFRGVKGHPYEQGFDLRLAPDKLDAPLHWQKPRMIFVNSMSDLFHEDVPDDYIDKVFAVMACSERHTYQVLTKRARRLADYMASRSKSADYWKDAARTVGYTLDFHGVSLVPFPLRNVWIGVSVENQKYADERIPFLLKTPAAVRFLSCEPLLGPIDFSDSFSRYREIGTSLLPILDWVIVGGESGQGARPFDIAWARSIIAQCKAAGVPCFVKQLGSEPGWDAKGGEVPGWFHHYDAKSGLHIKKLKHSKGGDPSEWPEDLRVREMPKREAVPA